ncbi:MAG: DNA gyrase subunit A [Geothrix sp.]|jgi:DNA gyrase subunit A|uniref:DNA gyrase subunit A n=1 Tax=Candidatus Geothrix odensensis TaxID=2954440 RepID=A0A936K5W7_9BACT|nr:DNA gyrase subunit A [Candidatus Geothrix odensensis]MCC6512476.1 DNA gyrase subunit A [Geothrix sp.]
MNQNRIEPLEIEKEMRKSYLDYAMSVIVGRALPDVRDGLKPVHRRVLFAMKEAGNDWNRAYKKSARTVGDVMGKYHPHGDSAIYDTLVRMAQPFSMRHVLVDGQGNFGSIDGDSAAAMRYTEARLSRLAAELMGDIDQDTVDFGPNYDGSMEEPLVLPSRFPNLLVNGSQGIAVGMATSIPPHNLRECCGALVDLIDNPALGMDGLMAHIKGPDFPGGGMMLGTEGVLDAYRTGRGRCVVRAKSHVEQIRRAGDREQIVFTELPYQVNKSTLIEKIAELVRDKKIDGISDLRDESDREGIRLVVELKKNEPSDIVLNQLYQQTQLQNSFPITMLAIVNGQPRVCTLREILQEFIGFRREVVTRRTLFQLRKAEERHHVLMGLKIALDHLDAVIKLIRAAKSPEEAKAGLMAGAFATAAALKKDPTLCLSAVQAQAILDMRLQRLTGLEREKILDELAELEKTIAKLKAILADESLLLRVIKEELQQVAEQFGNDRRTEITGYSGEIRMEDVVPDDPMVVTMSKAGYIKRTDLNAYRRQRRGGKGKVGMKTKDEDFVEQLFMTKAHDTLMAFTDKGIVYALKVYDLPEAAASTRGKHIRNLISLKDGENVVTLMALRDFPEGEYLVFATSDGTVKKSSLAAYANIRANGLIALNIDDDNRLVTVRRSTGAQQIVLATAQGKAIRFPEEDVRATGRATTGVRGMKLAAKDHIVDMEVADPLPDLPEGVEPDESTEDHGMLLTVCEKGYGKRSLLQDYRLQGRGGTGVINIRAGVRNGQVVGFKLVKPGEGCLLISQEGMVIRFLIDEVRKTGRNAQGVGLLKLASAEDRVVGLAKIDASAMALDEEDDAIEAELAHPGPDEGGEQPKLL